MIVLSLVVTFCKNCPSDENIGELSFSNNSLSFMPYIESDTILIFKNSNGQEITLRSENGKEINKQEIVVDKPCSYDLIDETNISMTVENQEILFKNDSIKILLVLQFRRLDLIQSSQIDSNWVESAYGIIGNSFDSLNDKSFSIITNDRGKDISQSGIDSYLFVNNITLNENEYLNVYSDLVGQDIFFNKELGVFGFRYNNILYTREYLK